MVHWVFYFVLHPVSLANTQSFMTWTGEVEVLLVYGSSSVKSFRGHREPAVPRFDLIASAPLHIGLELVTLLHRQNMFVAAVFRGTGLLFGSHTSPCWAPRANRARTSGQATVLLSHVVMVPVCQPWCHSTTGELENLTVCAY